MSTKYDRNPNFTIPPWPINRTSKLRHWREVYTCNWLY